MNSCIMCFSSMNKLTRTLLLLLTFLLTTMQSTTTTTIANNIATIKQTDTTIQPASTSTTSTTTHSNHNNNKNDFLAQPTFNVKLRGTLPLHRDNFLASLLSSKISNHNSNNYSNSNHHNTNTARNRNHFQSASTSTGARLASSGSGYYQSSNGNNKSQMNHNSRIQQYYNSISPLDYNSIVDHSLDHATITTTTTTARSLSTVTYLPVFDFGVPRNITARAGQTASITCRVDNLGDKSVSWIRKRDLHILTAGILTYTSDERFKVVRTTDSKNWSLHVKYAQPRDSGIYECQVNTEPKISMAFRLNVIVTPPDAKAVIIGPTDLYAKVGSAITLTCHVKQPSSAHDIGPIYWYRGPYVLTPFVAHPNDAAIDLQRISMESKLVEQLQSRLRIANAQTIDSGNYTCMPTTAEAASVMVNVINDESPAAMQKSSVGTNKNNIYHNCLLLILFFYALQHMLNVQRIAL